MPETNPSASPTDFLEKLAEYRQLVQKHLLSLIPVNRCRAILYDLMVEYPLREGKSFRPAFCLATCQACGGTLEAAMHTATTIELFHNAFLIHDDVEDGSESRRRRPTLHSEYGLAIATNVGDALNILAMGALLKNLEIIGLEKSLAVIREVERIAARETTEGQAIELTWVRSSTASLTVRDYFWMTKETYWCASTTPMRTGAIIAGIRDARLSALTRFGFCLGAAFQIQDDILNLKAEESLYGKEIGGDIWEGKRTLMFVHLIRGCRAHERRRVLRTFGKPRPRKTQAEVTYVFNLMEHYASIPLPAASQTGAARSPNLRARPHLDSGVSAPAVYARHDRVYD